MSVCFHIFSLISKRVVCTEPGARQYFHRISIVCDALKPKSDCFSEFLSFEVMYM